jgi:hypothetical protein
MRFLRSATFLRRLMLAAGLVALMPATGTALCLGELGHVAIELVDQECSPPESGGAGGSCATECTGCEDIPLSLDVADRVASRDELSDGTSVAALLSTTILSGIPIASTIAATRLSALASPPSRRRPALLRC